MTTEDSSAVSAIAQGVWESANINGCAAISKAASNETATARRLRLPLRIGVEHRPRIDHTTIAPVQQINRFLAAAGRARGCNGKSETGNVHVQIYCLREGYTILLRGCANFERFWDDTNDLARQIWHELSDMRSRCASATHLTDAPAAPSLDQIEKSISLTQ